MIKYQTVYQHKFVFLGSCTNSGSGLVRMLLSEHPEMSVLPKEGPKLSLLLPDDDRCKLPPRLFGLYPQVYHLTEKHLSKFDFSKIFKDWSTHWDIGKHVLFEKCPANATRMRLLQAAFPNALFIGLVRNPYAVSEGIRRRRGHKIEDCAKHWQLANETMLKDAKYLNRFLLLRYEDLTEKPSATLEQIFSFIGIEKNITIDTSKPIERHNITEIPQPVRNLNKLSISRLSEDEIDIINKIDWPFAESFGYQCIEIKKGIETENGRNNAKKRIY